MSGKTVRLTDFLTGGWATPSPELINKTGRPRRTVPKRGSDAALLMQALLEVCYDNGKGSLSVMSPVPPTLRPAVPR